MPRNREGRNPTLRNEDERQVPAPEDPAGPERALRVWVVLSRAYHSITAQLQADVARHDITLTEFGILEVLYHKGPLLLGDVQRRILVSSGGITYLVDRLEAKGFVERRACQSDRRARYAALTPEGEEFIADIFPRHAATVRSLLGGLDAEELATIYPLLRRLGLSAASWTGPEQTADGPPTT